MNAPIYLIDTNVFIGLEDPREVSSDFASLLKLAAKHHVGVYIHEAAKDDIARDRDVDRRRVSLSKLEKFPVISKVRNLTPEALNTRFGPLPRPNDVVDATLLHALSIGVADFVVTEDTGLHDRARRFAPELSRRILFVADAVSLLRTTYEPVDVPIRFVEEVEANTIPASDEIFDSLREGYDEFDTWWRKSVREQRKCWIVIDEGDLAGIVVRKDETRSDTDATRPGNRILKLCTFKVRPERRGTKLGELLLKQALWFAQKNHYEVVYLTTYPEQTALIDLLSYYGFDHTKTADDGELTFEKSLATSPVQASEGENLFALACREYPRFYAGSDVSAYIVPIKEEYHEALFPELRAEDAQPDLFAFLRVGSRARRPGNTIRKVYLCRAKAKIEQRGALLFFYKGRANRPPSQALTSVGVFEDMTLAHSTEELRRLAGGRSVYSERQLIEWRASPEKPVKVINFLLAGHLTPPMSLAELQAEAVFRGHPPQSIVRLQQTQLDPILDRLDLGFQIR